MKKQMNGLRRWINNLRLRTKLLLILLLAMALMFVSTVLTLRIPYDAYDEQLHRSTTQVVTLFADRIQAELEDMEALSYRILADNTLQESLSTMKSRSPGTVAWVEAKTDVGERMGYLSIWFHNARTLQLRTAGGTTFSQVFGNVATAEEITPQREALAVEGKGRQVWLAEEGTPPRLYLLRQIREMKALSLEPLATLLIEVDFPALVEKYREGMSHMGTPLDCAIYSGDICLYASGDTVRGVEMGEDGFEVMQVEDQDLLLVRYTAANGWRYVTTASYEEINGDVTAAARLSRGMIVMACLLALLLSALLITSLLRHLGVLVEKVDTFAISGHPVDGENDPYGERKDEIGQLHRHFDKMTRDLDAMTRHTTEQQRLLQEKQMQQLRAQVRPHFLYNTLESIYCLAQSGGNEAIATMTDALGKMLRASLNDTRDVVSLGEDLQITREYLRIQLIRYGDRLRVEYDIPQDLLVCRIPAMTLQPLVENAVHHAAEEMMEACLIRISAQAEKGGVAVTVEDNGPGMDEDMLSKLESGEIKPEGMGIGLRNIHRRVGYAFSARYGLEIRTRNGHTQVIVHLPDTRPGKGGNESV